MGEQLKPCPFCGGEAERTTLEEEGLNFGGDVITCKRCFASSHVEFGFKENLSFHWNTRTDLSQALIAAKLHEAAEVFQGLARSEQEINNPFDAEMFYYVASKLRALIPTDAQAALDAVRAEERERCKPKVKPLEWDKHPDEEEYYGGSQDNLVGMNEYDIFPHPCAIGMFVLDVMGNRCGEDFISVEAAKAAAQDDYERRILSALEAVHE